MNREREELIDFLLGEGEEPAFRDPAAEAELRAAIAAVRAAAGEGSGVRGRRGLGRVLRPALAAAAALLVAATAFLLNRAPPRAVYEPDVAYGVLLPEETDSLGAAPGAPSVPVATLRLGEAALSALGSARRDPIALNDEIPYESEVRTPEGTGARIDLPLGGVLLVGPSSAVRLMRHEAGGPALRLLLGVAATVAGNGALHVAVHETDLLVEQRSGALLLRQSPGEVTCLRGEADLLLSEGRRFAIPAGGRLPAACAKEPFTTPAMAAQMDLGWYFALAYGGGELEDVAWEEPGRSQPLAAAKGTMLFLRLVPDASGRCEVSFGGATRTFELAAGAPLALRLRLEDLGPGPRLAVTPAAALEEARLFRPGR